MQAINTRLTERLNIKSPIIVAPMAFASTPELAAAVTKAGGLGLIGAGFEPSTSLKADIQKVRQVLNIAPGAPVPLGVGIIGWIADMTEVSEDPRLEAILEEKPVAIWFAFGTDLGKYVKKVHEYDAKRDHKTVIFCIVNSPEAALTAAKEWKVDVLVVQGTEAGGHGGSESPPLYTLLPMVRSVIPADGPLIVAAGAIATGSQIAGLLVAGADGVVCGTRFLFTPECKYNEQEKSALIEAGVRDTQRGTAFDQVFRTDFWPPKHNGRAIANDIWKDYEAGLSLDERLKLYDDSKAKGEKSRLVIWAGVGVGLTNEVKPAVDVLEDLHREAYEYLKKARPFIA